MEWGRTGSMSPMSAFGDPSDPAVLEGSPGSPADEADVAERAGRAFDRDHDAIAVARQSVATVASGDRTALPRTPAAPALVSHGTDDRMCDVSGGRATAEAIPGAQALFIEGIGHNLTPGLWPRLADAIAAHVS